MTTIAHISDLHFGTVTSELAEGLRANLETLVPDVIVVSGDLTQRARIKEFQTARRFLDALPSPYLVVPGNHDIPAYDLFSRFFSPLEKYQQYITSDMTPFFQAQELAVLGINTARSLTWKNGRISLEQMHTITKRFCTLPDKHFKVLVTHHPFLPPPQKLNETLVGRARRTLSAIEQCNLDILLAGHFHMSYSGGTHAVYTTLNRTILVIQAGTATSSRTRGEPNAYNVIRLSQDGSLHLSVRMWDGNQFREKRTEYHVQKDDQWI